MTCKHGRLARSCPECDLMADLVEACHGWALAEEREKAAQTALDNLCGTIEWAIETHFDAGVGGGDRIHTRSGLFLGLTMARQYLARKE